MYKDIDEAIKSERIKAEYLKEQINSPEPCIKASKCLEMAEEHEQYIEWLEELKELRELKDTYAKGMETSYSEFRYKQGRADVIEDVYSIIISDIEDKEKVLKIQKLVFDKKGIANNESERI